jgi:hypothetical protein
MTTVRTSERAMLPNTMAVPPQPAQAKPTEVTT